MTTPTPAQIARARAILAAAPKVVGKPKKLARCPRCGKQADARHRKGMRPEECAKKEAI